jgi:hypothetical protein
LGDWPRPFVLRISHLDGRQLEAGCSFHLGLNVFDTAGPVPGAFETALAAFRWTRFGAPGGARLERLEALDPQGPCVLPLDADMAAPGRVTLVFATPTELKVAGGLARQPDFPVLFARLRDRLSALRALYGAGPLEVDFRGMGERAAGVRIVRFNLTWQRARRRSLRTGQVHPLGGFTGEAEYEGELREFLPWLRAARWVGVGRQTAWGKGEVHVSGEDVSPGDAAEFA